MLARQLKLYYCFVMYTVLVTQYVDYSAKYGTICLLKQGYFEGRVTITTFCKKEAMDREASGEK